MFKNRHKILSNKHCSLHETESSHADLPSADYKRKKTLLVMKASTSLFSPFHLSVMNKLEKRTTQEVTNINRHNARQLFVSLRTRKYTYVKF